MKLKSLKPRLQVVKTATNNVVSSSWRSGKSSTQRGYGYKWQKHRERFLQDNPLCVYCKRNGRIEVANVVDHIVPHRGNQILFWDVSNHQALCSSCHSSVKQKEENSSKLSNIF